MKNMSDRNAEMKRLKQEGLTLVEIGKRFKISYQRVGQIIGTTGQSKKQYPELRSEEWWKKHAGETTAALARELGCTWETVRRWRKRMGFQLESPHAHVIGEGGEALVMRRLEDTGRQPHLAKKGMPYDIICAGLNIEVKSSSPGRISSPHPSPWYQFLIPENQRSVADFFVLVAQHPGDSACFVIPRFMLERGNIQSISFPWPAHDPAENAWVEFFERWDLLGEI